MIELPERLARVARWLMTDEIAAALAALGWKGPGGPLQACARCATSTAWVDPGGAPRHPWCRVLELVDDA